MDILFQFLPQKAYLFFPLLAGMLYAFGTLSLKASSAMGVSSIHTTFACNFFAAAAFLGFYDWYSFPSLPHPLWPVILLAVLFVLGQVFTILALSSGDVSSITPVFSVKIICVGVISAFVLGAHVGLYTWLGAVICIIGIALLQVNGTTTFPKHQVLAILYAILASVSFGGFDAMTQYWSPKMGFGNFVPPALVLAAIMSLAILPRKKENQPGSRPPLSRRALVYLGVGVGMFTVQSLVLIRAIGAFGDAAGANVVYSARGLWGIFFVWLVGSWFGNRELTACPQRVIWARVCGAILVSVATFLVFL